MDREVRDELPKALKKAAAMGDLSENAEYQTAKDRQSFLQAQLGPLRERLAKLSLINLNKVPGALGSGHRQKGELPTSQY